MHRCPHRGRRLVRAQEEKPERRSPIQVRTLLLDQADWGPRDHQYEDIASQRLWTHNSNKRAPEGKATENIEKPIRGYQNREEERKHNDLRERGEGSEHCCVGNWSHCA